MGKGGAPTTTQTVQNQNVAYTPTGLQGFQDIYNRAASVASQPYQPYTGQLVQGLTPTQTGAIGNITNIAAQPLTSGQIQQYMNPYQQDVINATIGNINETNRQQMAQTTGQLTQAAGGVGAERIALGQGELARQQALASNQTLAGLNQQNYAQALQAAQQQQGFGLGAAQVQLGAGGLQQQTGQAGLTAAYQQYLQQLAFPYQQAQFLAGVGIPALGAMGGAQYQTGQANQTMTPPGLSWPQALAGIGAIGYGAYQGYNQPQQTAMRGGRIHHYDDGGGVEGDYDQHTIDLQPHEYKDTGSAEEEALAPVLSDQGYVPSSKEAQTPQNQIKPMAPMQQQQQPGGGGGSTTSGLADLGKLIGTAASVIPFFLKSGGRAGYDDGGTVPMQAAGMGMGAPGANAYPTPGMLGSPLTRGPLPQSTQMSSPNVFYGRPLPNMLPPSPVGGMQAGNNMYEMARQALQQQQLGQALAQIRGRTTSQPEVSISAQEYASGGYADGGDTDAPDLDTTDFMYDQSKTPLSYKPAAPFDWRFSGNQSPPQDDPRYPALMSKAADLASRYPLSKGDRLDRVTPYPSADEMARAKANLATGMTPRNPPTDISGDTPYPRTPDTGGGFDPATASPRDIMNLQNYKDQVAQRPTVRGLMSNPDFWMRTGLNILAANPQHGALSAIASGAGATVGEYDKWSKEDLSSKQKAEELAGKLMEHAQRYTRMTPAERERLDIERERLEQGKWQAFNYTDSTGQLKAGFMDTKTRQTVDSAGRPIQDLGRIYGRSSQPGSREMTPVQVTRAIEGYYKDHPEATGTPRDEVARIIAGDPALYQKYVGGSQPAAATTARPSNLSDSQIIDQARAAVQADPSKRDAILGRLKAWGIDTSGM